jgi:hypothetical protein
MSPFFLFRMFVAARQFGSFSHFLADYPFAWVPLDKSEGVVKRHFFTAML